jgi:hypothetical protein
MTLGLRLAELAQGSPFPHSPYAVRLSARRGRPRLLSARPTFGVVVLMVDLLATQTFHFDPLTFKEDELRSCASLSARGVFSVLLCWSVKCVVCVLSVAGLIGSVLEG